MQTDYNTSPDVAIPGQLADLNPSDIVTGVNEEASALSFGRGVRQGTTDDELLEMAAGAKVKGVTLHDHRVNDALAGGAGVEAGDTVSVLRKGRVFVNVEEAVAKGQQAYVRHTSDGGSNIEKGTWRTDPDGVAQVSTLTPTVANDTKYVVTVFIEGELYTFEYTSDGTATDQEICDGIRAAMAADAAFTALITGSGTTTVVMTATAAKAGIPFKVADPGPGQFAIVETTPASARAEKAVGCFFDKATTGAGISILDVNLPV